MRYTIFAILSLVGLIFVLNSAFAAAVTIKPPTPSDVLVCVQQAIDQRDSTVIYSFNSFSNVIKSALETRRAEQTSAWNLGDVKARKAAAKIAWTNYRKSFATAKKDFVFAKKDAWWQYAKSRRMCNIRIDSQVEGSEGQDSGL